MAAILLNYLKTREILKNREAKCLGFVLTRLPTGPEMGGRREIKVREAGGSDPALKNCFRFWCLVMFAGFIQFSLWFSVFVNNNGGFSDFSVQCSFTLQSC